MSRVPTGPYVTFSLINPVYTVLAIFPESTVWRLGVTDWQKYNVQVDQLAVYLSGSAWTPEVSKAKRKEPCSRSMQTIWSKSSFRV